MLPMVVIGNVLERRERKKSGRLQYFLNLFASGQATYEMS